MIEYPGNPATYPATVSLAEDGDNRNATVLENAIEDLADRTAYINGRTNGRHGTYGNMQSMTGVVTGDWFFVDAQGWYTYYSGVSSYLPPWVYQADAMGVGAWVHEDYANFFNNSSPAKIRDSLLPYQSVVKYGEVHSSTTLSFSLNGQTSWTQVVDASSVALTANISGFAAGDTLQGCVGPLIGSIVPNSGSANSIQVRLRIRQGSTDVFIGGESVGTTSVVVSGTTYYGNNSERLIFPFSATMLAGAADLFVEAKGGNASYAGALSFPVFDSTAQWGPAGQCSWLQWRQLRTTS